MSLTPAPNARDRTRAWLDAYYADGRYDRAYHGQIMQAGEITLTTTDLEVLMQTIDTLNQLLAAGLARSRDPDIQAAAGKVAGGRCICSHFADTGGIRIADLACSVHGVGGTEPGDGRWDDES